MLVLFEAIHFRVLVAAAVGCLGRTLETNYGTAKQDRDQLDVNGIRKVADIYGVTRAAEEVAVLKHIDQHPYDVATALLKVILDQKVLNHDFNVFDLGDANEI